MHNLKVEGDTGEADLTLMQGLVEQQPEALRALYERYHYLLYNVVSRVLHDPAETEDVLQEVFLQLWTRAASYRAGMGKPLGWLLTLARRRAIDRLRRRLSYQRAADRFESECQHRQASPAEMQSVEREVGRRDLGRYLHAQIARLPPLQKDVIELAFFEGMSQRQIASHRALPLGTVKTRLELGLRKLADAMRGARGKVS